MLFTDPSRRVAAPLSYFVSTWLRASVRDIVRDTCDATWKCLKQAYVSAREENYWMCIENKFYERKNFLSAQEVLTENLLG